MTNNLVRYAVDNGTATITLDSPDNRNALSAQLRTELGTSLNKARTDDKVRVIVLSHAGPVFCSGMDLKEPDPGGQGVRELSDLLTAIQTSPKPVVVRAAGPARAGGLGLVAAADIAIAATTATFAFSEVRLGLVAAVISVPVLPLLSTRAAQQLFLTGEAFTASDAVRVGLITTAVDAESLDAEVARYTGMLMLGGPQALAATKRLLRTAIAPTQSSFTDMLALSAQHFASEEGREGIAAFTGKRRPYWVTPDSNE